MKPIVLGLLLIGMAWFAVQGGEYGWTDLRRLDQRVDSSRAAIARLRLDVDSLARLDHALTTDSVTQEREARELYGMIRPGEIVYQVVPARDSSR